MTRPPGERVRALADDMRAALRAGAVQRMVVPARETAQDAAGTRFVSMPAVSPDHDLYVNKVATILTSAAGGSTVTAVVPVFTASDGRLLGVLDGAAVTDLKCAAVTALVTDRCAAPDSRVLGVIGSGVQAHQQVVGVSAVRDLAEVRVHSRRPEHAAAFARSIAATAASNGSAVRVVVCATAEEASRGVDILSTATTSTDPLPISPRLPDHVHVNCMGAHTTRSRELPEQLLRTSVLVVEDVPTAVREAGPLHAAAVELDVLDTPAAAGFAGRRTVFSSTGCAWLDLVTCAHLVACDDAPWIPATRTRPPNRPEE